jgi:hypothetical protein
VPRAKPFSRSEAEQRRNAAQVDPALLERLAQKAAVAEAEKEDFKHELHSAIRHYNERRHADKQERPARIVAALKAGLKPTISLLEWLKSQPDGVLLIEVRAGNIQESLEALIPRIKNRVAYWQRHVEAHRPAGKDAARLDLRQSLTAIIAEQWPAANEPKRRSWVAFALGKIGVRYPDEKKNRSRFVGKRTSKELVDGKRRTIGKNNRIRQSRAERRLKGVPI